MDKLSQFFNKEYLRVYTSYNTKKVSFFIFVFVFLFMVFFEPYRVGEFQFEQKLFVSFSYAIFSVLGYYISTLLMKPDRAVKWKIKQEIAHVLLANIFIAVLTSLFVINFLNYSLVTFFDSSKPFFVSGEFHVFNFIYIMVTSVICYAFLRLYDVSFFLVKQKKEKKEPNIIDQKLKEARALTLCGKNKNECLELTVSQFVYMKSEGHYVKVHYLANKNKKVESKVLRASMKDMELSTLFSSKIMRCHKSYLVNLDYIHSVISESNKSYANLKHRVGKVSVSKDKLARIKERLV